MLTLECTPEVIEALRHERFHHPHPHVQLKMEVLYLKSQGLPSTQIQRLCTISKATYYRYLKEYRTGGLIRTVGTIPAKADVEAQEAFKKNIWSRA